MKKSFKIGLAAVMIALATIITVFGAELPVNVVASGEKSVSLYFGEVEGKVWISLADQNGHVFHTKSLRDIKSYSLQYDLNSLPDGIYVLSLERADQSKQINLEIVEGKVMVKSNFVPKPSVNVEGSMVSVNVDPSQSNWTISIEDMERNIVFKETAVTSAKRTYDLSNLPVGDYLFEFRANGNSFMERISLKK